MAIAWIYRIFGLLLMTLLFSACTSARPYQTTQTSDDGLLAVARPPITRTPCFQRPGFTNGSVCIRFVEYDDFGNALNRAQLNETLAAAHAVKRQKGIIVVYVHGWEHNADSEDDDLNAFYRAMQKVHTDYPSKRAVFGIYVGWRGKSLRIPGLSKVTFWERKTTAQAIGDGAVFELFRKLADAREAYDQSRLVIIGHSFGAALTYASVFHSLTDQIIKDPVERKDAAEARRDTAKRWDMVVLLNPAFEAMQLRPLIELARSRKFLPEQLPHLILITTQADWATRSAFSAGRYFRSLFNKYADDASADLYRTAVGHYIPYVTHQLSVDACPDRAFPATLPPNEANVGILVNVKFKCYDDARAWDAPRGETTTPLTVLLKRCDQASDCKDVARGHAMKAPENMPIWNIRTTRAIMSGHNDIWNAKMRSFLVQMLLSMVGTSSEAARPAR